MNSNSENFSNNNFTDNDTLEDQTQALQSFLDIFYASSTPPGSNILNADLSSIPFGEPDLSSSTDIFDNNNYNNTNNNHPNNNNNPNTNNNNNNNNYNIFNNNNNNEYNNPLEFDNYFHNYAHNFNDNPNWSTTLPENASTGLENKQHHSTDILELPSQLSDYIDTNNAQPIYYSTNSSPSHSNQIYPAQIDSQLDLSSNLTPQQNNNSNPSLSSNNSDSNFAPSPSSSLSSLQDSPATPQPKDSSYAEQLIYGERGLLILTSGIKTSTVVAGSDVCATIPSSVVEIDQQRLEREFGVQWSDQIKVICCLSNQDNGSDIEGTIVSSHETIGESQQIIRRTAFFSNIQIYEAVTNVQLKFLLKLHEYVLDQVYSPKFSTITNKGKSQQLKRKRKEIGEDLDSISPSEGPKKGGNIAQIKGLFLPLSHTVNNFDVFFSTSQARVLEVTPDTLTVEVPKLPSIIDVPVTQDVTVEITVVNKTPRLPKKKKRRTNIPSESAASCASHHLEGSIKYTYKGETHETEKNAMTENSSSDQQFFSNNMYEYLQSGNTDPSNNTLLHLVATNGLGNLATDIALNHHCCFLVNQCNNFDVTPFMLAMGSDDSLFIQTCVDSFSDQLDLLQTNKSDENVFHYGVMANNIEGLTILLENLSKIILDEPCRLLKKAICEQEDRKGNTPLDLASTEVKALFHQHLSIYGISCNHPQLLPLELESKHICVQGAETDLNASDCKINISDNRLQLTFEHSKQVLRVSSDWDDIDTIRISRSLMKTQILLEPTHLKLRSESQPSSFIPTTSDEPFNDIHQVWAVEAYWEEKSLENFVAALRQLPKDFSWFSQVVQQ